MLNRTAGGATVRSAERRPVMGRSLRERQEIGDRLALRTDLALAERSTIGADRVDQMCAESAAQSARCSVSWPAAYRIPRRAAG